LRKVFPAIFVLVFSLALSLYAQQAALSANAAGTWQISWQSHRGHEQGTLHIQQEGGKLSGTLEASRSSSGLTGTIQGNNIAFNVEMQGPHSFTLAFTGTLEGDKMSGTLQPNGGEAEEAGQQDSQGNHAWSATRQQGKSGRDSHTQNQDDDYADGF
jgi:hypothetical protein